MIEYYDIMNESMCNDEIDGEITDEKSSENMEISDKLKKINIIKEIITISADHSTSMWNIYINLGSEEWIRGSV